MSPWRNFSDNIVANSNWSCLLISAPKVHWRVQPTAGRQSGRFNKMHRALRALHVSLNNASIRAVRKWLTRNSAIADKPRDAFRGQSRSPNMVPFHMLRMVSYYCATVTLSFWGIPLQKISWPWKPGITMKVIENVTTRWRAYDFLLIFCSIYGPISCRFWDIQCLKISRRWNPGQGTIKVIESGTIR